MASPSIRERVRCTCVARRRIGAGDEVITVSMTFIATAAAISYTGAKPVFVESTADADVDPSKIESKITPRQSD